MIRMRLKRQGRKRSPSYRIVVMDVRTKRDGKALDQLGFYDPLTKRTILHFDKIRYWQRQGAQPTETVRDIFKRARLNHNKNIKHFDGFNIIQSSYLFISWRTIWVLKHSCAI